MTADSSSSRFDARAAREPLALRGELWLRAGAETLGGAARIALLAAIGETGSITRAAKAVGLSYKGAWDAIDTMNNLAGEPLVLRSTGGKGGGGTTLTPRATALIAAFRAIEREHRRFIDAASAAVEGFEVNWELIGRIGMKTSARNQLFGKVLAVKHGAVNDEVVLALPGEHTIAAVVTHESTQELGLEPGVDACALVKASWIVLAVEDGAPLKLSARNQLRGVVEAVTRGAVNSEVALALDGGMTLAAIVTNDSVDALGLAKGVNAVAAFKASSVILAVNG
ncbi:MULTISPECIES: TOBE domain-containing protein [Burkholderia]|uniref:Molybdenum-dependent transcriptional regulator n=1 Tax=Burkholderia savannae TaxID=1637837 RepID=A0ABR5T353_9BURK|nr:MULTISPECIES: TOBE domain-containing protein [Burkholderia]AOJ73071.1 molybdenum-dependent transcriptional regulator [Burkholderia savannae]AOJ84398.1 molybdenum-dependent transcriptional regulator [Burkholderia savannae]AOK49377.1 molybdenum-dependent transcriptional regulator [Burkholderia sp. MSMB617WGS]KGS02206.1 molybdenum-pterin binding domain protein [Burkholderia sp. ABCPW 111]KVG47001.1 molybdenum-dependent transcriptional regulator [Burkholderia sp. MSMB0265]